MMKDENVYWVTDAFLSHPRTSSILRSGLRVLEPLDNWCQWQYCLNKTNVWLILNYLWNFSICIKIDIALDYVSGSSKNDVTMTEQVSIIKRAKSIVRNSCQPLIDYQVWYALLCLPILATQRSPSQLAHLVRNIWSSWVQYQVILTSEHIDYDCWSYDEEIMIFLFQVCPDTKHAQIYHISFISWLPELPASNMYIRDRDFTVIRPVLSPESCSILGSRSGLAWPSLIRKT